MAQLEIVFKDYKQYAPQTNKIFCFHTQDNIEQVDARFRNENLLTFDYNKYNKQKNIYAVPDFVFYNWKEAGLVDFYDFYSNMTQYKINQTQFEDKKDILFWAGNIYTHQLRIKLFFYYLDHKQIKIIYPREGRDQQYILGMYTMYEQGQFKYLLDLPGFGWSGRLKYLFLLKSVVFIVDRGYVEWWDDQFIPWIHYVPVRADATDLEEQFEKVKANQTLAYQIAEQGFNQAVKVFSKDNVYQYYAKVLNEYPGAEL